MLTKEEARYNLMLYSFLSQINLLPLEVNIATGEIRIQKGRVRRLIFCSIYFLSFTHLCYINARLVQSLLSLDALFLHHLSLHCIYSFLGTMILPTNIISFWLWPEITVFIFNYPFKRDRNDLTSNNNNNAGVPPRRTQPRTKITQYSRQELVYLTQPLMVIASVLLFTTGIILYPHMKFLLHSSFMADRASYYSSSILTYLMFLADEVTVILFLSSASLFLTGMEMLFYIKINSTLYNQVQLLRSRLESNEMTRLRVIQGFKMCRRLELVVKLFNLSNYLVIFSFKTYCLFSGIMGGYFATKYFFRNPAIGIFNYAVSLFAITVYSIMYEKAFLLPRHIQAYKNELLIATRRVRFRRDVEKYIEKAVRSVPNVGILGGFITFDRESTLNFIDFIAKHLAALLLTF